MDPLAHRQHLCTQVMKVLSGPTRGVGDAIDQCLRDLVWGLSDGDHADNLAAVSAVTDGQYTLATYLATHYPRAHFADDGWLRRLALARLDLSVSDPEGRHCIHLGMVNTLSAAVAQQKHAMVLAWMRKHVLADPLAVSALPTPTSLLSIPIPARAEPGALRAVHGWMDEALARLPPKQARRRLHALSAAPVAPQHGQFLAQRLAWAMEEGLPVGDPVFRQRM